MCNLSLQCQTSGVSHVNAIYPAVQELVANYLSVASQKNGVVVEPSK
jgi:hypothetical protein